MVIAACPSRLLWNLRGRLGGGAGAYKFGTFEEARRDRPAHPTWPRWRRKASARTQAIIASPTGTARMPTQGSWRPLVTISTSAPDLSIVLRGLRMEEVGLTAKRATTGWPVEMPPNMPPAWLARNIGVPCLPMRISSAFSSPDKAAAAK